MVAVLALACAGASAAAAQANGPVFDLKTRWADTNLQPGGEGEFTVEARNIGDAPAAPQPLTITDVLPEGVKAKSISWADVGKDLSSFCSGEGTETATCVIPASSQSKVPAIAPSPGAEAGGLSAVPSGYLPRIFIEVTIDPDATGVGTNTTSIDGGGAEPVTVSNHLQLTSLPSEFGLLGDSYSADVFSTPYPSAEVWRRAGDHPFEQRLSLDLNTRREILDEAGETVAAGRLKTILTELPSGFSGNPQAVPRCDAVLFAENGAVANSTRCPAASQVGYINITAHEPGGFHGLGMITGSLSRIPMYNLKPPNGVLADFGFTIAGIAQQHMYLRFDSKRNYSIDAVTPFVPGIASILGAEVTIWGVPGDPAHDRFRYHPEAVEDEALGAGFGEASIRPLITNPTDCGVDNGGTRLRLESYEHPGHFTSPVEGVPLNVDGCDDQRLQFRPALSLQPAEHTASVPSGLDLEVAVPQPDDAVSDATKLYAINGAPEGVGSPPVRSVVVQLPEGVSVAPGAAQGLAACSASQIGLVTDSPPRFDDESPQCPESSRIGTVTLTTPIEPHPLEGSIYVAAQSDNPFHSLVALYLAVEDPLTGLTVKLPVRGSLDPRTGRITLTLTDLPQQPFSDLVVHFSNGPRGVLLMPSSCGTYATHYTLTSWAGPQQVEGLSKFIVDEGCGQRGFRPRLAGGSIEARAGSVSSFVLGIERGPHEDNLAGFSATLPPGVAARLGSVPICSDASVAARECPEPSRIGSVRVAIGEGPLPLWLPPSRLPGADVYLAGPYGGAPFSLAFMVPGQAGPLDLGPVFLRAPIHIDKHTAQARVRLEQLPQVLRGVLIDYRTLRLRIDRPGFIRNPTSCERTRVTGLAVTATGTSAKLSSDFQAADCGRLRFEPKLSLRLAGALGRNGHPGLRATVHSHPGDAGLDAAGFILPTGELLDLHRIRSLCPRTVAPDHCSAASRIGQARIVSPFLSTPLEGPIYLREPLKGLPDLVADVSGEGVRLILRGRTLAPEGRLGIRLRALPDFPIAKATITLAGGSHGIFVNSRNLCAGPRRAEAALSAHSGRQIRLRPLLRLRGRC